MSSVHGHPPASACCVLGLQMSAALPGLQASLSFQMLCFGPQFPLMPQVLSRRLLSVSNLHQLLSCLTGAPLHSSSSHCVQDTPHTPEPNPSTSQQLGLPLPHSGLTCFNSFSTPVLRLPPRDPWASPIPRSFAPPPQEAQPFVHSPPEIPLFTACPISSSSLREPYDS